MALALVGTNVPRPQADFFRDFPSPQSVGTLYDIDSTVLRNRRVSLRRGLRVSLIGCTDNDLARLKLAAFRRSQQIQFLITFDFCQAAWLGDARGLLGRESGVIG